MINYIFVLYYTNRHVYIETQSVYVLRMKQEFRFGC